MEKFLYDNEKAVSETCQLAIQLLKHGAEDAHNSGPYSSVDPAPPTEGYESISQLGDVLVDQSRPLFERYRAMFALRNTGTDEAVLQLARGLEEEPNSELFRHEVAFVFGQMQHPASVPALIKVLRQY